MMENTLSIRIVNVDSYVALPLTGYDPTYSQFRGSTVPNVPVIRVFGITPQGVKTCVHVHCVFPYIVIPLKDEPNVDGFMHDLADNLEININKQMNIKGTNNQIFKITQITGIPFYGYHTAQVTFLKIFFYRPSMIKKAVEIMESGILLNRTFQPHESHITFTLQFLMDYNLHGMSFMNVANYTVRSENRVSFCDFEIDVLSQDILNAQNLGDNLDMNPGLAYIWEEEKTRRRLEGDSSQISLSKYENPISPYKSPLELQLKDKLINYLKKKVKNSKRSEATNSANMMDASFVESHSQDIYFGSIEDSQVKSLLEGLNEAWDEYEQAVAVEEDSILGSQAVEKIEDDEIEEMVHLSQPLEDSDDVFSDDDINKPSTSGLNRPLFVDGNSDETSPQKQKKKRKTPPRRYKALDIVKEKSPKKSSSVTPRKDYKKFLFAEQTIKKAASTSKFNSEEFENSKKPSAEASASKFDTEEEFETSKIKSFYFNDSETTISTVVDPPSLSDAEKYIEENNLRRIPEIKPFYSNDEPTSSKEVYKNVVSVQNKNVHDEQTSLGDSQKKIYETIFNREAPSDFLNALTRNKPVILTPIERPPDYESAKIWLKRQKSKKKQQNLPSQDSLLSTILEFNSCSETTLCSSKIQEPLPKSLSNSNSYLTLFCMELHVSTRANLNPDPEYDEIVAVFFNITRDVPDDSDISKMTTGVLTSDSVSLEDGVVLIKVENELEIIGKLIEIIRKENPDILAGYEIENSSWGYFIQRSFAHGINIIPELGRIQNPRPGAEFKAEESMRDIKITGRIVLNIWRMLRHEISVMSYTFESMMYHILNTRVAHYSYQTLTKWWSHYSQKFRNLTVEYYLRRVVGVVRILDSLDLIGRTAELATLFGIQFFEVLSRGSQFRVESMMLRLAKPMNFVAVSPNMHQRAAMRAPQCLPLIMEPESRFYTDPVIVLDFQSLYPSMMIAYNYCFSTCLGRVDELLSNDEITFGCTSLKVDHKELLALKDSIHISPAGVVFVESDVRKGVLPRMLEEILETRLMVKRSMSNHKNDKKLYKVLHARQLGLKLIANVTYGYTSANFSGRMPCIEVGDSVVSKGRETLERAIKLVNETRRWGARVVYGDTDSLFVLCPSKTKEEAFAIGSEIAREVTQSNPKPVKLKLEKVYQPCFLQTKKRYVGYMYESAEQERPQFDAKGIETVRRDGCIAASKILEKSLKILFESYDVSKVKSYVRSQLAKISKGEMSVQELTFAREYRGMNGYQPSACVPALKLIKEWLLKDRRAEPRIGERVGYVVVYGPPGLPIIRLVRSPHEFISNPSLQINSEYYIARVILPPLQRCFTLIGVDVSSWYKANPKIQKTSRIKLGKNKKETISQYFGTANCLICGRLCSEEVCAKCRLNPPLVSFKLHSEWASLDRNSNLIEQICGSCCGRRYNLDCDSLDCPVYFMKSSRLKGKEKLDQIKEALGNLFPKT